ncbi:uncharacterized protein LOC112057582 isoform X2 [Bicyclus anynana]|uniref:Uncharacterized protein LOC112057582 isoform X2 n=1 Tax=Bicyclus anynana TaxID=110368 RepID=A0ABM3M8F0_BICAN|nr:uncharacterized protein LOC112057582 isoform X2 [Bicyclus anynana]
MANFYIFNTIGTLLVKCEEHKKTVMNCRALGILQSLNGRFYLSDLDSKGDGVKIRISLAYVETSVPSTVIPYVVQVFGALQWTNKPVIFAKIVQVLDTHTGVRLNEALKNIENSHLANFSL